MDFYHLTVCASMANAVLNFLPSDNFSEKANLYLAARREMAYTASSST